MRLSRLLLALFLLAPCTPGHALRFSIRPDFEYVQIQVGSGSLSDYGLPGPPSVVDVVTFDLTTAQVGDGTPILGTPVIPFLFIGYGGNNRSRYSVTIDSSAGLINQSGVRIPFTDFSWISQDGDIPSGQFDGSGNQLLQTYDFRGRRARGVVDYLTFSYANTDVYPAGNYSGRVTYTITQL
ncbi:MAG: hypothetical protein ACWGPN_10695 [Gammaproteobacteria bacterium]